LDDRESPNIEPTHEQADLAASASEDDDFDRMLREMSQELSSEDDEDLPTEDSEDEDEDPDLEETVLVAPASGEKTLHVFRPLDTLSVSYVVQVSTGSGGFVETEAKGVLQGERGYPITALDDFAFGFDGMRNNYEIILDPNALGYGLSELPTGTQWNLRVDEEGQLVLDKPVGLRVAAHRIARDAAGGQDLTPLCNVGPEAPETIALPIEIGETTPEHGEFMIGMGLADTEPPSFAFSVYLAIRLGD
jgi:hypothetical protein